MRLVGPASSDGIACGGTGGLWQGDFWNSDAARVLP